MLERVLISDSVDPSCRQILESGGVAVDYRPGLGKEELLVAIKDYDGLIVRSGTKVTAEVIRAGSRLKLIGRAGVGVDNIDLEAATAQGVIVMNTPVGNTISAAEHTCALISALARNLPQGYAAMKAGRWDRKKFMGLELQGKTLGIVGLGRIGREVATRMQAYGMRTVGYDPLVPAEVAAQFNVEFLELEQIWPIADFVTVHTPLIPQTRGLVNDAVFASCKPGMRVVNVARGGIIDEGALLRALEGGQCGGAGLDVYTQEPPTDSALRALVEHPAVICTPHLGASTTEAQLKVAMEIAQQFVDAVQGKGLAGLVTAPYLASALSPASHPWLQLGQRLAKLAAAMLQKPPTKVCVSVQGERIKSYAAFVLPAAIVGSLGGETNLVNAVGRAKKMGIVTERSAKDGSAESVSVEVWSGEEVVRVEGAVLGCTPVLTRVGGVESGPVPLVGYLLVFEGRNLVDIAQELPEAIQLQSAGSVIIARLPSLPATHKAKAAVALD